MRDTSKAHADGAAASLSRLTLDEALAPFVDVLRQQLPTLEDIERAAVQRRKQARRRVATTVLTVLVLSLGTAFWLDPAYKTEAVATAIGERSDWLMPDGSRIELNTQSQVEVAMHLRSRRLRLLQGEATFTVAHAPWHAQLPSLQRPFTVEAGSIKVQDIGTVFNVRLRGERTQVTVLEGAVKVMSVRETTHDDDQTSTVRSLTLQTSDTMTASSSLLGNIEKVDAEGATAWRQGRLVFDRTPLREVVAELQRHRSDHLWLDEGKVAELRISGQFDLNDMDHLLQLLPSLAPVQVQPVSGGVRIRAVP